jgi:hypothetical protein
MDRADEPPEGLAAAASRRWERSRAARPRRLNLVSQSRLRIAGCSLSACESLAGNRTRRSVHFSLWQVRVRPRQMGRRRYSILRCVRELMKPIRSRKEFEAAYSRGKIPELDGVPRGPVNSFSRALKFAQQGLAHSDFRMLLSHITKANVLKLFMHFGISTRKFLKYQDHACGGSGSGGTCFYFPGIFCDPNTCGRVVAKRATNKKDARMKPPKRRLTRRLRK